MLFRSRVAHMLLAVLYMGQKPHEILFGEELWHKFSLKVPTRGFRLKKEIRWGDFPANFFDWRGADFHQKRKSCGATSPRDFSFADFDRKRCGKNHYFSRNSCFI